MPFGICQIGKAFRNEINPRNFTFRSREFEQMELEFFIKPGRAVARRLSGAARPRHGDARTAELGLGTLAQVLGRGTGRLV